MENIKGFEAWFAEFAELVEHWKGNDKLSEMNIYSNTLRHMGKRVSLLERVHKKDQAEIMALRRKLKALDGAVILNEQNRQVGRVKDSGKLADAMILADRISGVSRKTILKTPYPYNKKGKTRFFGSTKIDNALKCKDPADVERIQLLYCTYPEVFESKNVDIEALMQYCSKKIGGN